MTPRTAEFMRMLDEGRSLSGHERTVCYLNLGKGGGSKQFADISGTSGLDYDDDGRAIAVTDWDHDGDLDLWMSNRNAPRLRFMRNDFTGKSTFIQIGLRGGGGVNRDAIGTRVEIDLADGTRQAKTLRAGESYISQSSKWLHFGLGDEAGISKITVRWPDGKIEEVERLETGARYVIAREGGVERVAGRDIQPLEPKLAELPVHSDTARIPVVFPHPLPPIQYEDAHTKRVVAQPPPVVSGRWLLVNLWATWCAPCFVELKELATRAVDLNEGGIDVLALSVDKVATTGGGNPDAAPGILREVGFTAPAGYAGVRTVMQLQDLDNILTAATRPLPVPCSFLVDPRGNVRFIYKGAVGVDQLLKDAKVLDAGLEERWASAALLPGSTIDDNSIRSTRAALSATWNLRQAEKFKTQFPPAAAYFLGEALVHRADQHKARAYLASLLGQMGNVGDARKHLDYVLSQEPGLLEGRFELAVLEMRLGNLDEAESLMASVLEDFPDHAETQNNLAWLLVTHPDPAKRDYTKALKLARGAVLTDDKAKISGYLDTLAVAEAGNGNFAGAVRTLERAIKAAESAGMVQMVPEMRKRMEAYFAKASAAGD